MGKMMWSKLKFLLAKEGKRGREEDMDSLMSKPNVNEEYKQAFRTKSYIEICDKVKNHLVRTTSLDESHSATAAASPPSPAPPLPPPDFSPPMQNPHLFDYLLEDQETLITSISNTSNSHQFLVNYFKISLEACRICETLLTNIHLLRGNHHRIKKVLKLIIRSPTKSNDQYHEYLYNKLASFASQRDPFSTTKFQELHETHMLLFQELTSKSRKMNRRRKMIKLIKRFMASFLVMGCGALVIVLLILAMHCMVGLVAAPGVVMCALMVKKMKRKCNEKSLEGLVVKLDTAAKGVFVMINDFGTMSRIVKRLQDEMERRIYLADICVGKGKKEMLMNMVKEFQIHESWIMEELEDLEKQICLCFLDISRSRRLLVKEMAKC